MTRSSSDILDRLRIIRPSQKGEVIVHEMLLRMAADEIEKLRAQVVALQSSLDAGPPRPGKKTP